MSFNYSDPSPPNNILLMGVKPGMLTFSWDATAANCSSLHYNIGSTDCGLCPVTTNKTNASCSLNQLPVDHRCNFTVQSVVCGDIGGRWSSPIYPVLKGSVLVVAVINIIH